MNYKNCPGEASATIQINTPKSNINSMTYSGLIVVKNDLQGNLDLILEVNRCSLDMNTCEKYPGATIRDLCGKFLDKKAFYTSFLDNIKPALRCPIKAGNYTINEIKVDLTVFSAFPLDGYVWLATLRTIFSDPSLKRKRVAMCIMSEVRVLRVNKKKLS